MNLNCITRGCFFFNLVDTDLIYTDQIQQTLPEDVDHVTSHIEDLEEYRLCCENNFGEKVTPVCGHTHEEGHLLEELEKLLCKTVVYSYIL